MPNGRGQCLVFVGTDDADVPPNRIVVVTSELTGDIADFFTEVATPARASRDDIIGWGDSRDVTRPEGPDGY